MKIVIAMNSATRATLWRWPTSATEVLRARFPQVAFVEYARAIDAPLDGAAVRQDAALFADADAAIGWRLANPLWQAAPRLRWIHTPSAAVHQLLTPELIASDIVVTNGASVHADLVAEHALALLLALCHALSASLRLQSEHRWDPLATAAGRVELAGSTALLLGLGHIGRALAPKLAALGVTVLGIRRHAERGAIAGCAEVHPPEVLMSLLPRANFIAVALPVTNATRQALGAAELGVLPRGALVVNVGRGTAIDELALARALQSGHLGGAGLDVFATEPLPASSPLWDCPNVIVTPHVAAATEASWPRQVELITRHLHRFVQGLAPEPLVDKTLGY